MLILNADDWGRNPAATDRAHACFQKGTITAASFMVFMADSERAARLARECGIDVGLHINFTEPFTGDTVPSLLRKRHERLRRFLRSSKYALLIFNPFLCRHFREVFAAQALEFQRLFGHPPVRFDGHQHMHLATNMLLQQVLPGGTKVRRSFSFPPGEKSPINLRYRAWVDACLARRHHITDYFFSLAPRLDAALLRPVLDLARSSVVELMAHPERSTEFEFLSREDARQAFFSVPLGSYASF